MSDFFQLEIEKAERRERAEKMMSKALVYGYVNVNGRRDTLLLKSEVVDMIAAVDPLAPRQPKVAA